MDATHAVDTSDNREGRVWVPSWPYYLGLAAFFLVLSFPFFPELNTFIHPWRAEVALSVLLAATLLYFWFRFGLAPLRLSLSRLELKFVVYPLVLFVVWSLLSIGWASSWKSVIHHTCLWIHYLFVFLVISYLLHARHNLRNFTYLFFAVFAFLAVQALVVYGAYYVFGGALSSGVMFQRYGEQVSAMLPLLLVATLVADKKNFYLCSMGIASMWILVLCGIGRINIFTFAAGFIVMSLSSFLLIRRRARFRRHLALLLLFLTLPSIGILLVPTLSEQKVITGVSRLSGGEGTEDSSRVRLLLASLSLEMIKSSPFLGVGADNWGFQANRVRSEYGSRNADDPHLIHAEDGILERAHNEYLQIAAELGLLGLLIFAWLLFGIGYMTIRMFAHRLYSPFRVAALIGVYIFLVSSLVSSYSFRVLQNGFVFFFLLAICSSYFFREDKTADRARSISDGRLKGVFAIGIAACLALSGYSFLRVASMFLTTRANSIQETDEARNLYDMAFDLDNENPDSRTFLARRYLEEKRYADAVPLFQDAIRIGSGRSTEFSYLATAQKYNNEPLAAEDTLEAACRMYPYSAFVLTRYATVLRENGKLEQSMRILERSRSVDLKATNTWWVFMNEGAERATRMAFEDRNNYTEVMNLKPERSIYAVIDERKILHPEEALRMDIF